MAFNTTIRIRNQSSFAYLSRKREPPVALYVAQMIHSKTRNLSIISNISKPGMCIPQESFVQISVDIGNTVIEMNEKEGIAVPTNLRIVLFSTASVDNIDVATKSSSAVTSLHGTAASINHYMSSENQGQLRILSGTLSTDVKLKHLPKWYTEVPSTHLQSVSIPESKQPDMIVKVSPSKLLEDEGWLNVQNATLWAVFHAKKCMPITKQPDISALLSIWRDNSKSPATMKHLLDILIHATGYLNPG